MLPLFTKPIAELKPSDVEAIIGWPESLLIEFKRDLSTKDGRLDAWHTGGSIGQTAKTNLLKEIVALANTSGGHLLLGVDETSSLPSCASEIIAVPRCVDLAQRLDQIVQSIDPPVPGLQICGIPLHDDAGIVLFRVPASRSNPHRSIDKEIYVRRGTASIPVGMREIRDLILVGRGRGQVIDESFATAAKRFSIWYGKVPANPRSMKYLNYNNLSGWRMTIVPVGSDFELGRLFGKNLIAGLQPNYRVHVRGPGHDHTQNITCDFWPNFERPNLRGVTYRDTSGELTFLDVAENGVINFGYRSAQLDGERCVSLGEITAILFCLIDLSRSLSLRGGLPECEFGLEVELRGNMTEQPTEIRAFIESIRIGGYITELKLPRLSYDSTIKSEEIANILCRDICDSVGLLATSPYQISIPP